MSTATIHSLPRTPSGVTVEMNMDSTIKLIDAAYTLAENLHGGVIDVDVELGAKRRPQEEKAAVSRDLLYLQQLLNTAAAEVGLMYHVFKGRTDPREEDVA